MMSPINLLATVTRYNMMIGSFILALINVDVGYLYQTVIQHPNTEQSRKFP